MYMYSNMPRSVCTCKGTGCVWMPTCMNPANLHALYLYMYIFFAREKTWVDTGLSNSLKLYKWVPS